MTVPSRKAKTRKRKKKKKTVLGERKEGRETFLCGVVYEDLYLYPPFSPYSPSPRRTKRASRWTGAHRWPGVDAWLCRLARWLGRQQSWRERTTRRTPHRWPQARQQYGWNLKRMKQRGINAALQQIWVVFILNLSNFWAIGFYWKNWLFKVASGSLWKRYIFFRCKEVYKRLVCADREAQKRWW